MASSVDYKKHKRRKSKREDHIQVEETEECAIKQGDSKGNEKRIGAEVHNKKSKKKKSCIGIEGNAYAIEREGSYCRMEKESEVTSKMDKQRKRYKDIDNASATSERKGNNTKGETSHEVITKMSKYRKGCEQVVSSAFETYEREGDECNKEKQINESPSKKKNKKKELDKTFGIPSGIFVEEINPSREVLTVDLADKSKKKRKRSEESFSSHCKIDNEESDIKSKNLNEVFTSRNTKNIKICEDIVSANEDKLEAKDCGREKRKKKKKKERKQKLDLHEIASIQNSDFTETKVTVVYCEREERKWKKMDPSKIRNDQDCDLVLIDSESESHSIQSSPEKIKLLENYDSVSVNNSELSLLRDQEGCSTNNCPSTSSTCTGIFRSLAMDIDYPDELYHQPSKFQQELKKKKRSTTREEELEDTEEDVADLLELEMAPLFDSSVYDEENLNDDHMSENIPGFNAKIRRWRTTKGYEDSFYQFPPGVGIPPEEIEEIPDEFDYWSVFESTLPDNDFTDQEIEMEVMSRVEEIQGYFQRLEGGKLTEEELKVFRPKNFDGPYYPIPQHFKLFENLKIIINWELSPLHQFLKEHHREQLGSNYILREREIYFDSSHFKGNERKQLLRNWIKFQKQYMFYDLRPLLAVKTARILDLGYDLSVIPYDYISKATYKRFLLYMGQGLPKRTLSYIDRRLVELMTKIVDNRLVKKFQQVTGRLLAKLDFILLRFGFNFRAAELIIGGHSVCQLINMFHRTLYQKNIKLRCGPWMEEETKRFKQGILEVCKVKTLEEAASGLIRWRKVVPYVRTRLGNSLRPRLNSLLLQRNKAQPVEKKTITKQVINLIYNSDVDSISNINWYEVANALQHKNPMQLYAMFSQEYYRIPYDKRQTFEDAINFLYEVVLPAKNRGKKQNSERLTCNIGWPKPGGSHHTTYQTKEADKPAETEDDGIPESVEEACVDSPDCVCLLESIEEEHVDGLENNDASEYYKKKGVDTYKGVEVEFVGKQHHASGTNSKMSGKRPQTRPLYVMDHPISSSDSE